MLKGTLLHEIIHLPLLWSTIAKVDTSTLQVKKLAYGKQRRQYYLQIKGAKKGTSTDDKIVLYFHGGGWMFGTPEQFLQNAQVFTDQGYTVYMPSYRRLPYYQMKEIKSDLLEAIRHLTQIHQQPVNEVILSGMSGGGHLAALLALDATINWKADYALPNPVRYIGIGAPLDLEVMYGLVIKRLAGNKGSASMKSNSPIHLLDTARPLELFVLSAGKDGMVPYASNESFVKKSKSLGRNIIHTHFEDASHVEIAHWSIPDSKYHKLIVQYLKNSVKEKSTSA